MLTSVITPCHRRQDVPNLLHNFNSQTYANRELIVIVPDESFSQPNLNTYWIVSRGTVGELRNIGVQAARGEILAHMDSDDIYRPEYLQQSVDCLIKAGTDLCGLNRCIFTDGKRQWEYHYQGSQKLVLGATMIYPRSTWLNHPFQPLQCGEDNVFCAMTKNVAYGDYSHLFTAIRHNNNTSFPNFSGGSFTRL